MEQNIFELAKKLAALSPRESRVALRLIREHGYLPGERTSAVIDLARALISLWDGKASTLDQAGAWREVWKYLGDAGLVKESGGRSCVGQVLDILGDYRRMSAGAEPLTVNEPASGDFDKNMLEIKKSCADVIKRAPKAFTHCESSALIEKLASAMFNMTLAAQKAHAELRNPLQVLHMGCVSKDDAERIAGAYRKAHPGIAALWPTPQAVSQPYEDLADHYMGVQYDPYNAKPCHPSHELYKTGDIDAPESIQDRNGEVVLDQCRNCGRAESELLDGEPCAKAPANDNRPDPLTDPAALRRWKDAVDKLADVVEPNRLDVMKRLLVVQDTCYGLAERAGWWKDLGSALEEGEEDADVRSWPKVHLDNWISAKLMLIVTEVAEAMEGHRKGLMDDKLPHRGMLEVELADAVIRIMDLAGGLNMDVAGALVEKLAYNMTREDHKIENRMAAGGKSV